ncbi:MAG: uroporphyrinogen-III synthase [Actinobacteria bacterium]|nr:uroporphyrinogen-III synthase [Actinomycetota bacterium]MCL6104495.1 uroporphyrinogen-III synthase [Actinomycetota bacterium]
MTDKLLPPKPLAGWTVAVTRSRKQAHDFSDKLSKAGASVVDVPLIEIVDPLDNGVALSKSAAEVGSYEWVLFTSVNTVERFMPLLKDVRDLDGPAIAVVGPSTAKALERWNIKADLMPKEALSSALLDIFPLPNSSTVSNKILLPQARDADDLLSKGLKQKGWDVNVVEAYITLPVKPSDACLAQLASAQVITFASSSAVDAFAKSVGRENLPPLVACIGPITERTAKDYDFRVHIVAQEHTVDGLVEAIVQYRNSCCIS